MHRGPIALSLALLASCSLMLRPTDGRGAPIVDSVVAGAAGLGCLVAAGQGDGGDVFPPAILCVPLAPFVIFYGISAAYGFGRVSAHAQATAAGSP